jgi:hypothetical protein
MSSKVRKTTPSGAGASTASRKTGPQSEEPIDKAALVNKLLHSIEKRLEKDELKATLGDLIRLLQLQKELDDEQPGEIEVKWVEPEPVSANGE